jgi:hypothetical protein
LYFKREKRIKEILLSNLKRYFSIATFAAALKKVKVIVYARVHPNSMVKSWSLGFSQHCGQFEVLASQQANNTSTDVHNLCFWWAFRNLCLNSSGIWACY